MALVPIISQTWDTTSVFTPTRMNNIEQNLAIVSNATGVKYSNGVSVKDMLDTLDISSALTLNTDVFTVSEKQVFKNGNVVNFFLSGTITGSNGNIVGSFQSGYYPKCKRFACQFNSGGGATITDKGILINGENGRMFFFGSAVTSFSVIISGTFII